jgi:cytochrome P450
MPCVSWSNVLLIVCMNTSDSRTAEWPLQQGPFDPSQPGFQACKYACYRFFRDHDPVHRQPVQHASGSSMWYVFRHEDVISCLKDRRFARRPVVGGTREAVPVPRAARPILDTMSKWMLFQDPPHHTRLRALLSRSFTSRFVAELRPRIEWIAQELLEKIDHDSSFDVISAYAFPLPIIVIAEMMGIPPADREYFRDWSIDIVTVADKPGTIETLTRASQAALRMQLYLGDIIAHRRRHPARDLISDLVRVEGEEGKLSPTEVVATCMMLLSAGFETTGDLIGNGLAALLNHPAEIARVRRNPAVLATGIEELIRYDSPVQATMRHVVEDALIGGWPVRRGDTVALIIGSANRDERRFESPDELQMTRNVSQHASFGMGIHFCLGSALAKMEGEIAIGKLLSRYGRLSLRDATPDWKPGFSFAGFRSLNVSA